MCEVSKEPVLLTCGSGCVICLVRNVFQIYFTLGVELRGAALAEHMQGPGSDPPHCERH